MSIMLGTYRDVIDNVLTRIFKDGDGQVYAEDVNEVINDLHLPVSLYHKVAGLLDQAAYDLAAARDFEADPEWAWNAYYDGRYPGASATLATQEAHQISYEQAVNLILGLAALSQ